jgi:hypothetical protein
MLFAATPRKFPTQFAANAPAGVGIRSVPTPAATEPGAASYTTGFVQANFTPVSAGGIPPFGQDMNGILHDVTMWDRWMQAGGPVTYDSAFSASVNGYPRGALLTSNTGHLWFESLIDNNTNDPNAAAPVGWIPVFSPWSAKAWQATGSANSQLLTISPAPTSPSQLIGIPIEFVSQGTNNGPVSLNINATGAFAVQQANGLPLASGALVTGSAATVRFTGNSYLLSSQTTAFTDLAFGGLTISGINNTNGANLQLLGNGGTTPNKYIRALNGSLQVVNNAYTTLIMTLTDTGALQTATSVGAPQLVSTGNISAAGNIQGDTVVGQTSVSSLGNMTAATTITAVASITSNNGNVNASNGQVFAKTGGRVVSAGVSPCTTLADFTSNGASPGFVILPNGTIIQWGAVNYTLNQTLQTFNYPQAFPTAAFTTVANWGSHTPLAGTTVGSQPENAAQFSVFIAGNTSGNTPGIWWIATGR